MVLKIMFLSPSLFRYWSSGIRQSRRTQRSRHDCVNKKHLKRRNHCLVLVCEWGTVQPCRGNLYELSYAHDPFSRRGQRSWRMHSRALCAWWCFLDNVKWRARWLIFRQVQFDPPRYRKRKRAFTQLLTSKCLEIVVVWLWVFAVLFALRVPWEPACQNSERTALRWRGKFDGGTGIQVCVDSPVGVKNSIQHIWHLQSEWCKRHANTVPHMNKYCWKV